MLSLATNMDTVRYQQLSDEAAGRRQLGLFGEQGGQLGSHTCRCAGSRSGRGGAGGGPALELLGLNVELRGVPVTGLERQLRSLAHGALAPGALLSRATLGGGGLRLLLLTAD